MTYPKVVEAAIDAKQLQLQTIRMERNESTIAYMNRLDGIVYELLDAGHKIEETEQIHYLLRDLRKDYILIGKFIRMSSRSFTDALSHFINEVSPMYAKDMKEPETTLVTKTEYNFGNQRYKRICNKCGKAAHIPRNCPKITQRKCYHCKRPSNIARNSWKNLESKPYRRPDGCGRPTASKRADILARTTTGSQW